MASTIEHTFNADKPWSLARVRRFKCELKSADYYQPMMSLMGGGYMSFYVLPSTEVIAIFNGESGNVKRYWLLTAEAFDEVLDSADNDSSPGDSGYEYHRGMFKHSERLAHFDSDSMRDEQTLAYIAYLEKEYAKRR